MEFEKIYLTWRKGRGFERHIVGLLEKMPGNKVIFKYLPEAEELRKSEGFSPYLEFQDLKKEYSNHVVEIFAQRLMKAERPDIANFYKFWEIDIDKAEDKFYLLGKTQGLATTDNFEFLADYNLIPHIHFLTDLAALSVYSHPKDTLALEDQLHFKTEPENKFDPEAIQVFKDDELIGYIKKIHSRVFHKPGAEQLKLTVKALDQNGHIKKAFVRVAF